MRRLLQVLCLSIFVALPSTGCGGSGPAASGSAESTGPPPRAGEDTMKDAMQKLMQKGKTIPGVPKAPAKR